MIIKFERDEVEKILIAHLSNTLKPPGVDIKSTGLYGNDFEFAVTDKEKVLQDKEPDKAEEKTEDL